MSVQPSETRRLESRHNGETSERLLHSALNLFSRKGYNATSIREIIEDAGVTRPVLYYHFKNKERLFTALVEAQFAQGCAEIDSIIASVEGCRNRLKALINMTFERAGKSPEMVRLLLQFFFSPSPGLDSLDKERLAQERFSRIERIMKEGLEADEVRGGSAELLARAFASIMDMQVMAKANRPETALAPDFGEALVDLFLDGAGVRVAED